MKNRRISRLLASVLATALVPAVTLATPSTAGALTCNTLLTIDATSGANFLNPGSDPGDEAPVTLSLGTGSIVGGTQVTISRLRYELDCNGNNALGIPCTDQGTIFSYEGDSTIVAGGMSCSGIS